MRLVLSQRLWKISNTIYHSHALTWIYFFEMSILPISPSLQRLLSEMNCLLSVTPPMRKIVKMLYLLNNLVNCKYKSSGVVAVLRINVFEHCSTSRVQIRVWKYAIERIFKNRFQRFHKQGIWFNTLVVLLGMFGMSGREEKISFYVKQ